MADVDGVAVKRGHLALSLVALGISACESQRGIDLSNATIRERSASQEESIQGGTLDTTSSNVVAILIGAGQGGICTGSLIAPNLVLTARHCVGSTQGNLGSCSGTTFGNPPYPASSFRYQHRVDRKTPIEDADRRHG